MRTMSHRATVTVPKGMKKPNSPTFKAWSKLRNPTRPPARNQPMLYRLIVTNPNQVEDRFAAIGQQPGVGDE